MKIIKCEQLSPEWWAAKKGKMSASNAQAIQANGRGLESYIYQLLAEKYSNNQEHYTNADMERGIELEESARMTYAIEREEVEQVGLVEYNDYFVASPDGLLGNDGCLEIKCMNDANHFRFILDQKIQSKWLCQMQAQLLATGRSWAEFVAYNPNFVKSLVIVKVEKDLAMQEKLIVGIEKGKKLIRELEAKFKKLK